MRFTLSWLKQFLDTDASLEEIVAALTNIGFEVENVSDKATMLSCFEVAEIIEATAHPDASKLQICKVKAQAGILQIVCGASNARAGIKVVLANVGAIIPNGQFTIKASKIRGVDSCGMLCSADELGLGNDSEGIIELDDDAIIGDKIAAYLGVDDPVIHVNITPNRADGLGVYGIARDLAAFTIGTLKTPRIPSINENFKTSYNLSVNDQAACPLFGIREIKGIKNIQSPKWLKNLLENIGIGSISAVVDVTNYICYSFGQPMHAYDSAKIKGGLAVSHLASDKVFNALNGKEYNLTAGDIVIGDEEKLHCLAGIIGGADSAVTEDTKSILLEAAVFNPKSIMKSGRRLAIDTDSRYRFERNVDQEFTLKALDFATGLILEICGGVPSELISVGDDKLPQRNLEFPIDFLRLKTNLHLPKQEILMILEKLGFNYIKNNDLINIKIPSWRYDVSIKEDIVEEIARIYGYDNITPEPLPSINTVARIIPAPCKRLFDIKRLLASCGYDEVISWSFMDSQVASMFTEIKEELMLENPISSDLDYMRPTILPNLLTICRKNINRSISDLALFEVGPVFHDTTEIVINHACGVRIGHTSSKNAHNDRRLYDVFDIKADITVILGYIGLEIEKCQIKSEAPRYYHPTRSAALYLGKNLLGYFGQVHPLILKKLDIEKDVFAFELNINSLPFSKNKFGKRSDYIISNYQSVARDYAFIVDQSCAAGALLSFIANIDKKLIHSVELFDIYSGDKVGIGKKSLAFSVILQAQDKTLGQEEINIVNKKIIEAIEQKFNGILRDA